MNIHQSQLHSKGFTVAQSLLTNNECRVCIDEAHKIFSSPPYRDDGESINVRSMILDKSQPIARIFFQNKVIKLLESILGPNFILFPEISLMRSQYGGWHKDTTSIELFGYDFHKNKDFNIVNVALYLQDNTSSGGGLDVIPASHLENDAYTNFFREKDIKDKSKKLSLRQKIISKLYFILTNYKLKISFFRYSIFINIAKRPRTNTAEYVPLNHTDPHLEERIRIPTRIGDLLIFDLRTSHKASWPDTLIDASQGPEKYAIFFICGENNPTSTKYMNYLHKRAVTQQAYSYLKRYNPSLHLTKFAYDANIKLFH